MSSQHKPVSSGSNLVEQSISEEDVLSYLKSHPDFFRQNAQVLGDMTLPHSTGNAVSLVERQVAVLRERSMSTRRKLSELLDNAKENDALFFKTQALVLKLIRAGKGAELFTAIESEFKQSFDVQHCAIFLQSDNTNPDSTLPSRAIENTSPSVDNILNSDKTFCGPLRQEESDYFFNAQPGKEAPLSAAIAVRATSKGRLVVAVAHDDGNHYTNDTGTLFIDYIADVTEGLLDR